MAGPGRAESAHHPENASLPPRPRSISSLALQVLRDETGAVVGWEDTRLPPPEVEPIEVSPPSTQDKSAPAKRPKKQYVTRADIDTNHAKALERTSDQFFVNHMRGSRWPAIIKALPKVVLAGVAAVGLAIALQLSLELKRALDSLRRTNEQRNERLERDARPPD